VVRVRGTLSYKDYTPEEVQACWYSDEETQRIRAHFRNEIRKMKEEESKPYKDIQYCSSRGLEGHTTVRAATKRRNRLLATNAVLDEQLIQWEQGIFDEHTIAEIYLQASYSCQMWANIVGQRDHRETAGEAAYNSSSLVKSCSI
jgi:hypothetical protein